VGFSENVVEQYTGNIEFDKPTDLWGQDNIHMGFYPHLVGDLVRYSFAQAADMLTKRMVIEAGINHTSNVLDLGSGKGRACVQIAQLTGAACTGVDFTPGNVARARELALSHPELSLTFVEGSFLDLPPLVRLKNYTHVFSVAALVHVHRNLAGVFEQVKTVLEPGGVLVVSDFVGSDSISEKTLTHWYSRAGIECCLHSHSKWRQIADLSNLTLLRYENLDMHQRQGYLDLMSSASEHGSKNGNGAPLAESYWWSADAVSKREIGMNMALYSVSSKVSMANRIDDLTTSVSEMCQAGALDCNVVGSLAPELESEVGTEEATKRYYTKAAAKSGHTDRILGKDNIHTGYYPELARNNQFVELTLPQAANMLTQHMVEVGRINHTSSVLDLGSGKGHTCFQIASRTGANCTGLDLTPANVERSLDVASQHPWLRLSYVQGSMTQLPAPVLGQMYSHVFAQLSTCYLPKELPSVLAQVRRVLLPGGLVVIVDHTGGEGQFEGTVPVPMETQRWYDRLHLGHPPRSKKAWRQLVDVEGFEILLYENLDQHMAKSYRDAADTAATRVRGVDGADGGELAC